jgi:hypothetical protein
MNKHVLYSIALSLAAGATLPIAANAATVHVSGHISGNTTWTSDNTYVVDSDVTVDSGVTLTVQAGTAVKFSYQTPKLVVNGALSAVGTATSLIYFTTVYDPTVGSYSNTSVPPDAGFWDRIEVGTGASSTITNASIRYADYSTHGAVYINGGTVTLDKLEVATSSTYGIYQTSGTGNVTNSDIYNAGLYGVYLKGGTATISSSKLHKNGSYGVYVPSTASSPNLTLTNNTFYSNNEEADLNLASGVTFTHSGNSASGTGKYGFAMDGALASDQTWSGGDLPYIVSFNSNVSVPAGTALTIQSGAILKLYGPNSKFTVGGTLRVQGTSDSPVYFTSFQDDAAEAGGDTNNDGSATTPVAGDWDTLEFDSGASSTINYAVVRYGGCNTCGNTSTYHQSDIYNPGGNLTITGGEVATSTTYGIYQTSGTSTVASSDIHDSSYGFNISGGNISVTSSIIHNNTTYGAYIVAGVNVISTSAIHDNAYGIYDNGGDTTVSQSDIYSNTYGAWVQHSSLDLGLSESAIDGNTSYGVYNNTGDLFFSTPAEDNWWASYDGPSGSGSGAGDQITTHVDYNPWHHNADRWSVRSTGLNWYGSTQYSDEWNTATSTWSETTNGVGLVGITHVSTTAEASLIISDTTDTYPGHPDWAAWTTVTSAPTVTDTLTFSTTVMTDMASNCTGGTYTDCKKHVAIHELGHALGLGHSDPVSGDVMYSVVNTSHHQTTLGPEDKSDYTFLWSSIYWDVPNAWLWHTLVNH